MLHVTVPTFAIMIWIVDFYRISAILS